MEYWCPKLVAITTASWVVPNLKVRDDDKLARPQNAKAQELGLKSQQSIQRPSTMLVSCGGGEISLSKRFKGITLFVKSFVLCPSEIDQEG